MTLSNIGNDIFIGDSAATSHMTNNKTGVYELTQIRGSVMIGNGESISCTHKGKLDVICKHRDGSMARETWEVKIVPQLNHDLFSFTKAMKEGWQMNGRRKEGGPLKGIPCCSSRIALTCRPTPFQRDSQWEEVGNLEVR